MITFLIVLPYAVMFDVLCHAGCGRYCGDSKAGPAALTAGRNGARQNLGATVWVSYLHAPV